MMRVDIPGGITERLALLRVWFLTGITKLGVPDKGYALGAEGAAWLVAYILQYKPKLVVELGSGFSTLALGYACAESCSKLITADNDAQWLSTVRAVLALRDQEHKAHGEATLRVDEWSSLRDLRARTDLAAACGVVLVDHGPSTTRVADLPWIASLLSADGIMALDDCRTFTTYEQRARDALLRLGFVLERAEESFGRKRYIGVASRRQ
jgi:predicted O-methyltransferase YrrM